MIGVEELNRVKVYYVGGFVRDGLLQRESKDVDFSVEAPSFDVMREWVKARGDIFQEKPEYLTIRASGKGLGIRGSVDFVMCRKDGTYADGRRPDYVEPGTIYDDLARRDFTMNAIAKDMQGGLIDPHGGRRDIEGRVIRCVGSAVKRITEDSLRLLRAIRFSITLGFTLDEEILDCLSDEAILKLLRHVSSDRKREELNKCFVASTADTLDFLGRYPNLLRVLFCEDSDLKVQVVQRQPK